MVILQLLPGSSMCSWHGFQLSVSVLHSAARTPLKATSHESSST